MQNHEQSRDKAVYFLFVWPIRQTRQTEKIKAVHAALRGLVAPSRRDKDARQNHQFAEGIDRTASFSTSFFQGWLLSYIYYSFMAPIAHQLAHTYCVLDGFMQAPISRLALLDGPLVRYVEAELWSTQSLPEGTSAAWRLRDASAFMDKLHIQPSPEVEEQCFQASRVSRIIAPVIKAASALHCQVTVYPYTSFQACLRFLHFVKIHRYPDLHACSNYRHFVR